MEINNKKVVNHGYQNNNIKKLKNEIEFKNKYVIFRTAD